MSGHHGTIVRSYKTDQGIFHVEKGTPHGNFSGEVRLFSEDEPYANDLVGYQFAERKCDIKAQQIKSLKFTQREIAVKHLYDIAAARYDENSETVKFLRRQLGIASRDAENEQVKCRAMKNGFKEYTDKILAERKQILEKYKVED